MDAIAIREAAKAIETLATELAAKAAQYPNQGEAQELTKQIIAESVDIQKLAGGWTVEMAKVRP